MPDSQDATPRGAGGCDCRGGPPGGGLIDCDAAGGGFPMHDSFFPPPIAATIDLQYRLPPFQQILWSPTIMISLFLVVVAVFVLAYLSARARREEKRLKRREDLGLAKKILTRRGGTDEDFEKLSWIFDNHPNINPAGVVLVKETFNEKLRPFLEQSFSVDFAERMEGFYFPAPKDSKVIAKEVTLEKLVEDIKHNAGVQAGAAMIDLMDRTVRPGLVLHIAFDGVDGAYDCLVMGYDLKSLNVTLPANNARLLAALKPGTVAEGSFESGASLMAFATLVEAIVAGSMPFCRLAIWKNAWEVRKRESIRLGLSVDIDFQHISTAFSGSIRMSQLDKGIGSVRPGKLRDLSLGGGCIETQIDGKYNVGDLLRFIASLIPGHPPATLLGAIVEIDDVACPEENNGMVKRLHVQFLALDDVSQRLLVRAMRQLQDVANRIEWQRSQQLLEEMRRNNIPADDIVPPPSGAGDPGRRTRAGFGRDTTTVVNERKGRKGDGVQPEKKDPTQSTSVRIAPRPDGARKKR